MSFAHIDICGKMIKLTGVEPLPPVSLKIIKLFKKLLLENREVVVK